MTKARDHSRLSEEELIDFAVQNPLIKRAFAYHEEGAFSESGTKLVFWANDLQPDPADPTKNIHYGNKIAKDYQKTNPEARLMSNAENVNSVREFLRPTTTPTEDPLSPRSFSPTMSERSGFSPTGDPSTPTSPERDRESEFVPISTYDSPRSTSDLRRQKSSMSVLSLDALEKEKMLSKIIPDLVAAVASNAFAKSAKDIAVISAYGASPKSFFRTVELDVIMSNENVRELTLISRLDPKGKTLPKKEAYHQLRDSWLESSVKRLEASKKKLDVAKPTEIEDATKDYESKLSDMAEEIVIAIRNKQKDYPFSRGNSAIETQENKYTAYDKEQELKRIARGYAIIKEYPDLQPILKKMLEEPETLPFRLAVIARLEKDDSSSGTNITFAKQRSATDVLGLDPPKKPKGRRGSLLLEAAKTVMKRANATNRHKFAEIVDAVVTTSKSTNPKAKDMAADLVVSATATGTPTPSPTPTPKRRDSGIGLE